MVAAGIITHVFQLQTPVWKGFVQSTQLMAGLGLVLRKSDCKYYCLLPVIVSTAPAIYNEVLLI